MGYNTLDSLYTGIHMPQHLFLYTVDQIMPHMNTYTHISCKR